MLIEKIKAKKILKMQLPLKFLTFILKLFSSYQVFDLKKYFLTL
jgi:hypothetical protein